MMVLPVSRKGDPSAFLLQRFPEVQVVSLSRLVQDCPIGEEEDDPPIPFVHRGFIPESFTLNVEGSEGNIVSALSKSFTEGDDFFPYLSLDLRIPASFPQSTSPIP